MSHNSMQVITYQYLTIYDVKTQVHDNKNSTSGIIHTHCLMSAHRSNDMERATSYLNNRLKFFLEENSCFYAFFHFTSFFLLL